jgi:colanic acid biosynthesis glycosyl transferase WcaI
MAKILLLTLVYAPDGVSTAMLLTTLAQELKGLGHEVTVLTTTPHYNVDPVARAKQPLSPKWKGLLYQSDNNGIPVLHASIPVKGNRVGARLLDYLRFHAVSTVAALTSAGNYDIILAPSPPLTIGLSAWLLSLIRRVPFIYNVQEIYPDVAVKLGVMKNAYLIRFFEGMEKFIYDRSKVVTVISEWFRRILLNKGVPSEKLVVIPNFVDVEAIQPHPKENPFARDHNLTDKFVVLYAGNIGLTQGFESILEATTHLLHLPDLRFVIVGDGTRREWLEQQLTTGQYPNVLLLPYQASSVIPQIYGSADVGLVPLKTGTAKDTFPSKVYTIMAAGKPVIASADADSELAWLVEESQCGWAIPPDDASALAQTVERAYRERDNLRAKGESGLQYVHAHHSSRAVAQKYDALIRALTVHS